MSSIALQFLFSIYKIRYITSILSFLFQGYVLGTTPKNWEDARTDCKNANADLVTVNSATEQNYLIDLIKAEGNTSASYWIGYHDKVTEGTFKWVTGGSSFTNWDIGESTDSSGLEDCTVIDPSVTYKWKDSYCNATVSYICEKCEYEVFEVW